MIVWNISKYIVANNAPKSWPLRFAYGFIFQVYKRLLGYPFCKKLSNGKSIMVYSDCAVSSLFIYSENPEKDEIQTLRHLLKANTCFMDIGANMGAYSMLLLDKVSSVIAFEPDKTSYTRLATNFALNNFKATLESRALSDFTGVGYLSGAPGSPSNSLAADDGIPIEVTTLDAYAREQELDRTRPYLLKIDVEGAELSVLLGAQEFLQTYQVDGLVFESFPDVFPAVREFLVSKGFCVRSISHHNYVATPV